MAVHQPCSRRKQGGMSPPQSKFFFANFIWGYEFYIKNNRFDNPRSICSPWNCERCEHPCCTLPGPQVKYGSQSHSKNIFIIYQYPKSNNIRPGGPNFVDHVNFLVGRPGISNKWVQFLYNYVPNQRTLIFFFEFLFLFVRYLALSLFFNKAKLTLTIKNFH